MKYFLTILFFVFAANAIAQNNSFVKYFDSSWQPCAKDKATFYTQFEKQDTVYKCTSYYLPSNKLYGKSTYYDTLFKHAIGLIVRYYENGVASDSTYYEHKGKISYQKKYYKSGKIHSIIKFIDGNPISEAFDENGNSLFTVVQIPAEFNGGLEKWKEFLEKNLKGNVPSKNKAPAGKYTVILKFLVNEEGIISDIIAENNPGYGTKEEAIRVLSKSPKWKPAIQNGKAVTFRHRQSITFMVSY